MFEEIRTSSVSHPFPLCFHPRVLPLQHGTGTLRMLPTAHHVESLHGPCHLARSPLSAQASSFQSYRSMPETGLTPIKYRCNRIALAAWCLPNVYNVSTSPPAGADQSHTVSKRRVHDQLGRGLSVAASALRNCRAPITAGPWRSASAKGGSTECLRMANSREMPIADILLPVLEDLATKASATGVSLYSRLWASTVGVVPSIVTFVK